MKLKPVIFVQGDKAYHRNNSFAQNLLLKALSQGITDVKELRQMAGLKSAADVIRTFDKLSLRKEYHAALSKAGISFDYIVGGIKGVCDTADSDAIKLKGFLALLKSMGLDRYEKQEDAGQSWEETIIQLAEGKDGSASIDGEIVDYEVDIPVTPEDERVKRQREKDIGSSIYE